ncbi:MAG TPA: hypothetical protein VKB32_11230 [Actinomycetota bacterium]|nr:hypothetical protein [Actinomycetota bacterium]
MAVTGEPDRCTEGVLPAVKVALHSLQLGLGGLLCHADAVLLGLEQIERDRVRVEGLQQLASLFGDPGERLRQDDAPL